jgi:thiamine-phosphate pyrophosphorylase
MIQLREPKGTSTKQWIIDARKIKSAINNPDIKFIINNRADVAFVVQADGVHIGGSDISTVDARKMLGDEKIIGVTACNSIRAIKAEKDGADYIGVGAIFPSITKPTTPVVGISKLKRVIQTANIPVVAIGGINSRNAKQLFKLGVSGVAVVSSVFKGVELKHKNISRKIISNLSKFN